MAAKPQVQAASQLLERIGACSEARKWVSSGNLSLEQAWRQCCDPEWLLFLACSSRLGCRCDYGWMAVARWIGEEQRCRQDPNLIKIAEQLQRRLDGTAAPTVGTTAFAAALREFAQYSWSVPAPAGTNMLLHVAVMDLRYTVLERDVAHTAVRPWMVAGVLSRLVEERSNMGNPRSQLLAPWADLVRSCVPFQAVVNDIRAAAEKNRSLADVANNL